MRKLSKFKKIATKKGGDIYFDGRLFGTEHYILDTERLEFELKDPELNKLMKDRTPFTRGVRAGSQTGEGNIRWMPAMDGIYAAEVDPSILRAISNTGFQYSHPALAFSGKKDTTSYLLFKDDVNGDLYPINVDYRWAERFILFGQGSKSPIYLTTMGEVVGLIMPMAVSDIVDNVKELGLGL